jgi:hypothetical protein
VVDGANHRRWAAWGNIEKETLKGCIRRGAHYRRWAAGETGPPQPEEIVTEIERSVCVLATRNKGVVKIEMAFLFVGFVCCARTATAGR